MWEMIVTNAATLKDDKVGFGESEWIAKSVFNSTWRGLLLDGYVAISSVKNPLFIEIVQRGGPTALFLELRYTPPASKATAALSNHTVDIETFYRARYCAGSWVETEPDFIQEVEHNTRREWHRLGLYTKRGQDYDGIAYTLLDSEADDAAVQSEQDARELERQYEREARR